ncbi:MAG: AraC family transcriptional regulator [Bacteroidia bacterium]|nr:AraC family transcriptional regulator [Bacteroidia bacterium]
MRTNLSSSVMLGSANFPARISASHLQMIRESHTFSNKSILAIYASGPICKVKIDHLRFELLPDQFILVNPGREVQISPCDHGRGALLLTMDSISLESWKKLQKPETVATYFPHAHGKLEVCEQIFQAGDSELGLALSRKSNRNIRLTEEESHTEWADLIVKHQWRIYEQLQRLTSAKLSTRKELYSRLCKARRYMVEHLNHHLDLDTLAQVACLSKYHFIRLFKEVFEQTPRQYLIALRLERASKLLRQSDLTFHEICQEVGLKDSSSFGRLFKRSFGATPHTFRQMRRDR